MNLNIFLAGILCILLGLAHSIIGEFLIFKNKREKGKLIPSKKNESLKRQHLQIIWATWHLATLLSWCIGGILLKISSVELNTSIETSIIQLIIYTMLAGSVLVLISTKGKHPGWIVLLVIGILLIFGK